MFNEPPSYSRGNSSTGSFWRDAEAGSYPYGEPSASYAEASRSRPPAPIREESMSDAAIAAAMQHEEDARASYAMQYEDAPPPPASSGLRREDVRPLAKADLRCTRAGVAAGALFDVAALFVLLLIASKRFPWGGGDPSEAPAAELVDLFDAGYWTGALQNLSSLTASHWLIALGAAAAFPLVGVVGAAALWRWALWVYAAFLVAAITLRTWVIFQLRHPPLGGGAAGAAAAGVLPAELSARALRAMLVLTICIFVDVALFQSASRLALLEGRRRAQVDPGGGGGGGRAAARGDDAAGSTRSGRRGRSQRNGAGSGVTRGVEISNGGSSANLPTAGSWAGAAGLDAASSLPGADAAARENRTMRL